MKINKEQLKSIIKECIVEVLAEGLGQQQKMNETLRVGKSVQHVQSNRKPFDPRLDTPVVKKQQIPSANVMSAVKASAGKNSVMESIFADTAATTLMEQASHGDTGSNGASVSGPNQQAMEHIKGTPEEVFGEDTTSRWANLAFMPVKKSA